MMLTFVLALLAAYVGFGVGMGFGRAVERNRVPAPRRLALTDTRPRAQVPEPARWN